MSRDGGGGAALDLDRAIASEEGSVSWQSCHCCCLVISGGGAGPAARWGHSRLLAGVTGEGAGAVRRTPGFYIRLLGCDWEWRKVVLGCGWHSVLGEVSLEGIGEGLQEAGNSQAPCFCWVCLGLGQARQEPHDTLWARSGSWCSGLPDAHSASLEAWRVACVTCGGRACGL